LNLAWTLIWILIAYGLDMDKMFCLNQLRISFTATDAPCLFAASLRQWGFAVLRDCPISADLIAAVYGEWAAFFSSDQKYDYTFDPQVQSGFFPWLTEHAKDSACPDLKEFYHLYPWSPLPQGLSPQTWQLFKHLEQLAAQLLAWLEQDCPQPIQEQLSQPLSQMITESPQTLLRLLHYPPVSAEVPLGSIRAAAHEDVNLLTLLPAATAGGLEIKITQAGQAVWQSIPAELGDIVVNVGDMLQLASQGYYRSTTHRVVNPSFPEAGQSRYAMPLFLHPRPEVVLAEQLTAQQFLSRRLAEIGLL
jgi:isopenicillin N synthase-like dioxygenase